jgi:phage baseplate assembly protein V
MTGERSRSTDKRYYGVVTGLVVAVDDPERQGRIKVRYPWFDDETVSGWSRVGQLYAGPGHGAFFIPEVGSEVLIAFIHGDMRYPIVVAGLYNGKDSPPAHRDASTDPKLVRTRGGHQLLLDDSDGKRKVEIVDTKGNRILIDSEKDEITVTAASNVTVESKGGKLTLKGVDVAIEGSASIKLKAPSIDLN